MHEQKSYEESASNFDTAAWSKIIEPRMERWNESREQCFESAKEPLVHLPEDFFDNIDTDMLVFPADLNSAMRKAIHTAANRLGMKSLSEGEGDSRRLVLYKTSATEIQPKQDSSLSAEESVETHPHIGNKLFEKALYARLQQWCGVKVTRPENLEVNFPDFEGMCFDYDSSEATTHCLFFPATLTPARRRLVHINSLKLGLYHASIGSGNQRQVVISKTGDFTGSQEPSMTEKVISVYDPRVKKPYHMPFWVTSDSSTTRSQLQSEMEKALDDVMIRLPLQSSKLECRKMQGYPTIEERGYVYVQTEAGLIEMAAHLDSEDMFGFDIEFHNYRSYFGITCLLQISSTERNYIVDTLAVWDHMPLLRPLFADPEKLKIAHDMKGSDAPALFRDFGIILINCFDTHDAAEELKLEQLGLSGVLLKNGLPESIHKQIQLLKDKYQISDWRTRPLCEDALTYAALDSHYLIPLYHQMREAILCLEDSARDSLSEFKECLSEHDEAKELVRKLSHKEVLQDIEEDEVLLFHDCTEDEMEDMENDNEEWEGWGEHPVTENDLQAFKSAISGTEEHPVPKVHSLLQASKENIPGAEKHPVIESSFQASKENTPAAEFSEEHVRIRPHDVLRNESFSSHIEQPPGSLKHPSTPHKHPPTVPLTDGEMRLRSFMLRCQQAVATLWKPKKEVSILDYKKQKQFKYAKKNKKNWSDLSTAVFAELFRWRDQTARELDEGVHYLCSPDMLVEIARRAPDTLEELKKVAFPISAAIGDGDNDIGRSLISAIEKAKKEYGQQVKEFQENKSKLREANRKNEEQVAKLRNAGQESGPKTESASGGGISCPENSSSWPTWSTTMVGATAVITVLFFSMVVSRMRSRKL